MILYKTTRYEPDGRLCHAWPEREMTPGKATVMLVRFELGYGGSVIEIRPTYIKVSTSCMGLGRSRYDHTEFSGSEEAMKPLLIAVGFWYEARKKKGSQQIKNTVEMMMQNGLNLPIHAALMTTTVFRDWASPTLCVAAGLNAEQATTLLDLKLDKDIIDPIFELLIEGSPFDEAMEFAKVA